MAKNPKAADRTPDPVSSTEGAPAATAAVPAPTPPGDEQAAPPAPDPDAEAELRRLEDEALAQAQRDAAAVAAAAEARAIAREGKIVLLAPEDVTGASAGGDQYAVDDEGVIAVHPDHVPALLEHGFLLAE